MADELRATVINMKTLSQNISDPVVVGAGDASGRILRIIFTQEAAAQFTESTKVYLSWHHQEKNIKGYNVFTKIENEEDENFPPTWEIRYPKSMLYEGNVLACIQLVDEISIATSTNFMIHVLIDPNDGSTYTASDDYTDFQKAVIIITSLSNQMRTQLTNQKLEFEDMQLAFMNVQQVADSAQSAAEQAEEIANQSLTTAQEALNTILDFTDLTQNLLEKENNNSQRIDEIEDVANNALERTDAIATNVADVAAAVREVAEKITNIKCECGLTEEEVLNLIQQELSENYITQDQLTNYATLGEVEEKLRVAVEEAQGEHEDIWNALNFSDYGFEEG